MQKTVGLVHIFVTVFKFVHFGYLGRHCKMMIIIMFMCASYYLHNTAASCYRPTCQLALVGS